MCSHKSTSTVVLQYRDTLRYQVLTNQVRRRPMSNRMHVVDKVSSSLLIVPKTLYVPLGFELISSSVRKQEPYTSRLVWGCCGQVDKGIRGQLSSWTVSLDATVQNRDVGDAVWVWGLAATAGGEEGSNIMWLEAVRASVGAGTSTELAGLSGHWQKGNCDVCALRLCTHDR